MGVQPMLLSQFSVSIREVLVATANRKEDLIVRYRIHKIYT